MLIFKQARHRRYKKKVIDIGRDTVRDVEDVEMGI
jgi:hypothetical protein